MDLASIKDILLYNYFINNGMSPGEANSIILLYNENAKLRQENEILRNDIAILDKLLNYK